MVQIQQPMLHIRPEDIVRGYVNSRDVEAVVMEYPGLKDQETEPSAIGPKRLKEETPR